MKTMEFSPTKCSAGVVVGASAKARRHGGDGLIGMAVIESRGSGADGVGGVRIPPWMDGEDASWRAPGAGALRTVLGNGPGSEPLAEGLRSGAWDTHEHRVRERLHWEKQGSAARAVL